MARPKIETYVHVTRIEGHNADVDIVFDAEDRGFHLLVHEEDGFERFIGRGNMVTIYKTYDAAVREASKHVW